MSIYARSKRARQGSIMARKPYEAFEHTADIGLRISGSTLPELFTNAAAGMESLLVAPEQIEARVSREVTAEGHDVIALLISWLNELIFLFDTDYLLCKQFTIDELTDTHLRATVSGEPYDAARHDLSSAIKAATWHEASVTADDEGYTASVILDI